MSHTSLNRTRLNIRLHARLFRQLFKASRPMPAHPSFHGRPGNAEAPFSQVRHLMGSSFRRQRG